MKNKFLHLGTAMLVMVVLANVPAAAQQSPPPNDSSKIILYASEPVWKDMLDDPNANYFEVQRAFTLFWENRELPLDEDDIIGESRKLKNNLLNRTFNSKELKAQMEREALAFDCKKYRWWLLKTEPFIHEDGSIMTTEERLEIWKKHYEELEGQNK
jgi:hypothetical protein